MISQYHLLYVRHEIDTYLLPTRQVQGSRPWLGQEFVDQADIGERPAGHDGVVPAT